MAEPSFAAAPGAPSGEPVTGTCRHCHEPIVRRPYYLDRPRALPLVWVHADKGVGLQTCRTRPDDWTEPDWPLAEPATGAQPGSDTGATLRDLAAAPRAEVPPVLALSCLLAVPAISVCDSVLSAMTSMSRTVATKVGTKVGTAVGHTVANAARNLGGSGAGDGR